MSINAVNTVNRLYPKRLPQVGDIVISRVVSIDDDIVRCELLEYAQEGMLPFRELSNRRLRNYRKVVRIGAQEVLEVTSVDEDQGYIDLSKKDVLQDSIQPALEKYYNARKIHRFLKHWSTVLESNLITTVLWPLYEKYPDIIAEIKALGPVQILAPLDLDPNVRQRLAKEMEKLVQEKAKRYETRFELSCSEADGIKLIQHALNKGMEHHSNDFPLTFSYTGKTGQRGSIYVAAVNTTDKDAEKKLTMAIETVRDNLSTAEHYFSFV